jgi:hypothetical protein
LQYFFVTGNPKSGTTWMQLMLDAHPNVVCSGEGHFIYTFLDPLLKMKDGFNQRQKLAFERVYQGKRFYNDITNDDVIEIARAFMLKAMTQRVTAETLAVGDKTPKNNRRLGDLGVVFPEAKVINIVRHPYDMAVSRLHHARRAGIPQAVVPGTKAYIECLTAAAQDWTAGQEGVARLQARRPGVLLELRYEDMLVDPHTGARAMFRHIGVSDADAIVNACVEATAFEALSGGRKPGEEHATSFFRKGVAGDWEGVLDAQGLAILDEICGPLYVPLGYAKGMAV